MDETMQKNMVSAFRNMSIFDLGPSRGLKIHLRAKLYEKVAHICANTRGPVNVRGAIYMHQNVLILFLAQRLTGAHDF